jgi:predicted nucleic-acid-binding Zn-ribbon protein
MRRLDEAVREWAAEHWKNERSCPICGTRNWQVNGELFRIAGLRKVAPEETVNLSPLVGICCPTCGYVFFLDAWVAGLYTAEELLDVYHGRAVPPGGEAGGFPLTPDGES